VDFIATVLQAEKNKTSALHIVLKREIDSQRFISIITIKKAL